MDFERHRPRRDQHDARGVRGGLVGDVLRLSPRPQVGHGHLDQRVPRRTRRDHVSVLLGVAVRSDLHRCDRRSGRGPRRRLPRMGPRRRPDRRVAGARLVRDLGNVVLGLFATGQYGVPGPTGADTSTHRQRLFYGGGCEQLEMQILGSVVVTCATFVVGLLVMYGVKANRNAAHLGRARARRHRHRRARRAGVSTPSSRTWVTRRFPPARAVVAADCPRMRAVDAERRRLRRRHASRDRNHQAASRRGGHRGAEGSRRHAA